MAEKTEKPTDKKLKEAKEKGQVSKSTEVTSLLQMIVILIYFLYAGKHMLHLIIQTITLSIGVTNHPATYALSTDLHQIKTLFLGVLGPLALAIIAITIFSTIVQVGPIWASKAVKFSADKLSIIKNAKNLFSVKSLFELLKNIIKVLMLILICAYLLKQYMSSFKYLSFAHEGTQIAILLTMLRWILEVFILAYAVFSIADYYFQTYSTMKELKMSKDDVKQERKDIEGNPEVKDKRNQLRHESQNEKITNNVAKSTIVIKNPTHLAIGLYYHPQESPLPKVLIKAKDKMALHIIHLAEKAGVPVVENIPLARSLYQIKTGDFIHEELFETVAQVLRMVMDLHYDDDQDENDTEGSGEENTSDDESHREKGDHDAPPIND